MPDWICGKACAGRRFAHPGYPLKSIELLDEQEGVCEFLRCRRQIDEVAMVPSHDRYSGEDRVTRIELPQIDLAPLDELITARRSQWREIGTTQTLALNKSCILILSALLQGYIEEVFFTLSANLFVHLSYDDHDDYRRSIGVWGNPNAQNIERLFMRIGEANILERVTWQRTDAKKIRKMLGLLNEQRNAIAHGKSPKGSLKLSSIERMRDFVNNFAINLNRYLRKRFRRNLRPK